MTERTFYRRALFLPLIGTIISWLIIWASKNQAAFSTHAEGIIGFAIVFGYGGLWAAPAYILVAVVMWALPSRKSPPPVTYSQALVAAPIATIIVGIVIALVIGLLRGNFALAGLAVFYAAWGILLGYTYVIAILAIRFVAVKAGWVAVDQGAIRDFVEV